MGIADTKCARAERKVESIAKVIGEVKKCKRYERVDDSLSKGESVDSVSTFTLG